MEALKALIEKVDDDYLTGLCNKGTVKRAYKDLEQEEPHLTWQGEEAQVALKEETCMIRVPLGESSCSCPSRSICRHIVTSILWMKQGMAEKSSEGKERHENEKEAGQELLQIPLDQLKRACKTTHYRQFLAHMHADGIPPVLESSIVTVELPWEKATVKLLEPFAHSTCTCHSRELCVHKAQAVLAYQLKKGKISLEELDSLNKTEDSFDLVQIKEACEGICESISQQLCMGLSRQSPEVSESLESLCAIAHRAGLPDLESRLREGAAGYGQYFARSAAFRSETLLHTLLVLYRKGVQLKCAKTREEIRPLAGYFRDTYEPAGRLRLMSMGGRTFSSKTGYEGEIYYFLETQKKEWYTWTDARPVFYEGIRKKPPAYSNNVLAPWGLNCSREQMQTLEFDLQNARAASGGRLSVSQESKAEIIGTRSFEKEEVRQMVVWDYEKLLAEHFAGNRSISTGEQRNAEKLALVGAVRWGKTSFDTVQQRFSWSIYDQMGRALYISLKYSKEERTTIRLLERLEQKLQNRKQEAVIVFGSLYLDEDGRMCLFPIEFFLEEGKALLQAEENWTEGGTADAPKTLTEKEGARADIDIMLQYHREAQHLLSDLFASGLYSVQEDIIAQLSHLSKEGESLGLHHAGGDLGNIAKLLQEKRHQIDFLPEPVIMAMGRLDAYLRACGEKLSYDRALVSMKESGQL